MAKEKTPKVKKRYYEPECSPEIDVTEWQIDDNGHHHLVVVGKKNFDDEIQLYKDACDIKILIDRMMKGDAEVIMKLQQPGVYGDVNDYPQEYHPAAGRQALQQLYENQPDSVKNTFQTFEAFEDYFTKLTDAMVQEKYGEKPAEEVVTNEQ